MSAETLTVDEKRQAVIDAHRHVASLLEEHDDLPLPIVCGDAKIKWSLYSWECPDGIPAMVAHIRRTIGGKWDKAEVNDYGTERMRFSTPGYEIEVHREAVCTRRVVGSTTVTKPAISLPERTETTEIVEWDCHSLLSDGAA